MGVKMKLWKGAWWVFVNHQGHRKAKRIGTGEPGKRAAKEAAFTIQAKLALGELSLVPEPRAVPTLAEYAETWLTYLDGSVKASTGEEWRSILRHHLLPVFGSRPLPEIRRDAVKAFLAEKLASGLSPKRVKGLLECLHHLLNNALDDGLLEANPSSRLGKFVQRKDAGEARQVAPLTVNEVRSVLETAQRDFPKYSPLFLTAALTGLREGEVMALQRGDLDFAGGFLDVKRALRRGRVSSPKNGKTRRVDMPTPLAAVLRQGIEVQEAEAAFQGVEPSPWLFPWLIGHLGEEEAVRRAFYRCLARAGVRRVRFHDLRHTYASLLLQRGESLTYVKDQLGHHSITLTVDVYGHLVPGANRQAVEGLAEAVLGATKRNPRATALAPIPEETSYDAELSEEPVKAFP